MKEKETQIIDFYKRVNEKLREQKKTQIELCNNCAFSLGSFRTKASVHSAPNVFDACKIAEYLNTSVEFLATGEEKKDGYKGKFDGLMNDLLDCISRHKES